MDEIILIKNKEVMAMRKNDRETTQGKNIWRLDRKQLFTCT
jgi:hypothetical protein